MTTPGSDSYTVGLTADGAYPDGYTTFGDRP